jgi:hypothetical protein
MAARSLTQPPSDIVRSDLEVERLMADSYPCRALRAIVATVEQARGDALLCRLLRPMADDVHALSRRDRIRLAGLIATGSAIVALAVTPLRSGFRPWPDAVLPAAVALAGLLVAFVADPLARARDKRS